MGQIVAVVKQAEAGMGVVEFIRPMRTSEQTFCRRMKPYDKLEIGRVRKLMQLQEGNARLIRPVLEMTLVGFRDPWMNVNRG